MQIFTTDNCNSLHLTCLKIKNLLAENIDGELMLTQKIFLGELISEFANNPIMKYSGVYDINIAHKN